MSDFSHCDVAIVGAGISGLMSAVRLADLGVRVVVLEQGEQERYLRNSRYTGGAFHVANRSINDDENVIIEVINQRTRGCADPDLAKAVAADTRKAVQWLKSKGLKFVKGGPEPYRDHTLAPPILPQAGLHWEGRGGDVMLRTLGNALKAAGGTLMLGSRARQLRMDDGTCVGLTVERQGVMCDISADAVILCDGGFQANHGLLREFITSAPEKLKQRNAGVGNGDALRMAREIGARLVGTDKFYGHVLCQDAMHNDRLWPFPVLDTVCTAALVVDGAGRRFADEGLGGICMANSIARLPDPLSATLIYDEAIWNGPARGHMISANPLIVSAGATILKAESVADLARQLRLSAGALEETVKGYNAALDAGHMQHLTPPRTPSPVEPHPIRHAPYYAIRLCAGITSTMGGIAIDSVGRVQNESSTAIPGLYAVGCSAGGLEGGPLAGYVGQLAQCSSIALRAAHHIATLREKL